MPNGRARRERERGPGGDGGGPESWVPTVSARPLVDINLDSERNKVTKSGSVRFKFTVSLSWYDLPKIFPSQNWAFHGQGGES